MILLFFAGFVRGQDGVGTVEDITVDADLGSSREGSRTGMLHSHTNGIK